MKPSIRVPSYNPQKFNNLCFVAQSPGKNEVLTGIPLIGASGKVMEHECSKVGISWKDSWRGNVIEFKPPGNDFEYFCDKKANVGGKDYKLPMVKPGAYLKPEWFPELERLRKELEERKPNLIVALGSEALWALTTLRGITKYRGTLIESTMVPGTKILPTFHPASTFRQHSNLTYLILDLFKAKMEMTFPEIRIVEREIHLYPEDIEEIWNWYEYAVMSPKFLEREREENILPLCSVDIEDRMSGGRKMIECIGFAFSPFNSLVVPFWSDHRENNSYWRTVDEELEAWRFVQFVLNRHLILGQNFMTYDAWVLWKEMHIQTLHPLHDTMIQHHAFQPEMKKGLGVLSSIYCNVPAYKTMKPRGKQFDKRDE